MPKNTKKKNQKDTKDPVKLKVTFYQRLFQNLIFDLIGTWQQSILE